MKKYAIVPKRDDLSGVVAKKLKKILGEKGLIEDALEPEIVVVVGGDGSFLFAVQEYLDQLERVALVGIHTGTLGFFMDYTEDELEVFVDDLLKKELVVKTFPLLEVTARDQKMYAVNEVRIENPMRTQDVTVYLDGEEFEELRSSGLCIATQLGSTAYNRSLGGAILQENMPAMVLTEIAGIHHHQYKSVGVPFVMSDDTVVTIKSDDYEGAYLGVDSTGVKLTGGGEIVVKKADKQLRVLRLREISHFERIRRLF